MPDNSQMEQWGRDFDRAVTLSEIIAKDMADRIEEEFPEAAEQNATAILVFGYIAGVCLRMEESISVKMPAHFIALFALAKEMGNLAGASDLYSRINKEPRRG